MSVTGVKQRDPITELIGSAPLYTGHSQLPSLVGLLSTLPPSA